MKLLLSLVCFGLLVVGIVGFTSSIDSNGLSAAPVAEIDWYWGHCDIPAGSVCARCVAPGCAGGGPGGKPIPNGGSSGCNDLAGAARGTSCPGVIGWCPWNLTLCGNVEDPDCCLNNVTLVWEPCCVLKETGCPGC
ncbi:MAG: hypothetical protein ACKVHR_20035 [Pirellulales bacterium]|jgi:hypothetical protein